GALRAALRAGTRARAPPRPPPAPAPAPGLARRRARDVPRHRPPLLVAGRAAVAESRTLAALDHPVLPAPRRPPEHDLRRAARLLGAALLSRVRRGPAPRRAVAARRSGGRGGRDC